jgi:hypothetical protein
MPYALLYACAFFFPCVDDTPPSSMASFSISRSGSDSRPVAWNPWLVLLVVALLPWMCRISFVQCPLPAAQAPVQVLYPLPHAM